MTDNFPSFKLINYEISQQLYKDKIEKREQLLLNSPETAQEQVDKILCPDCWVQEPENLTWDDFLPTEPEPFDSL